MKDTARDGVRGLPVTWLVDGRPCLVVGAGRVALRKVEAFLAAGARVTVVAPEAAPEIAALAEGGRIRHVARAYESADVAGQAMVVAATDDPAVNAAVLADCRRERIPCGGVDRHWPEGDFITPAVMRRGEMTVAISTGGRSCRQARLVRQSLDRHIEAIESADLLVLGTSHELLSVGEREPFHLAGREQERVGGLIAQVWGVHEFLLLNTCNRIELVATVSKAGAAPAVLRRLLRFDTLKEGRCYAHEGPEAFEHLCLVVSGLRSQSLGENHIAAQMKDALASAVERGWAGGMMQQWVSAALHVSKHIRNEIGSMLRAHELEDVALQYVDAHVRDLPSRRFLVIGAGVVGRGLVEGCLRRGARAVWCYHVRRPEVPPEWGDRVVLCSLNEMKDHLRACDVILSAADAPGHVLHAGHAPFFDQERELRIVDLAMPRNVSPDLERLSPDWTVLDLDGLKNWHRDETGVAEAVLDRGRRLVAQHREMYDAVIQSLQGRNADE
jgi:precorrin-2 dehydrogenase/sirohydrochlorin ferrochelatase